MTDPVRIHAASTDIEALSKLQGRIALLVDSPDTLDVAARRVNRLTRGALARPSVRAVRRAVKSAISVMATPCRK